jgi:hypothetical protein
MAEEEKIAEFLKPLVEIYPEKIDSETAALVHQMQTPLAEVVEEHKPYVSGIITDPEVLKTKVDDIDDEIPERIEKHHNSKHHTETRIFLRHIHEHFCDQPDCEFFGKRAAQGICWETTDPEEAKHEHYLDYAEAKAESQMKWTREHRAESDKEYIDDLESQLICEILNHEFTLDECIRLRIENAKYRIKLGEWNNH